LTVEQALLCPVVVVEMRRWPMPVCAFAEPVKAAEASSLVSGEAGVGKSRLLAELITEARAGGFLLLRGGCVEADRAAPYAPLLDLVRTFAVTAIFGRGRALFRSGRRGARDALARVVAVARRAGTARRTRSRAGSAAIASMRSQPPSRRDANTACAARVRGPATGATTRVST